MKNLIPKNKYYKPFYMEIKKIEDKDTIKNLITFDIETWGLNPNNLGIGIFYNGKNYVVCYDIEEILKYIDSLEENTTIFAHNGSNFDYQIFFNNIIGNGEKWTISKRGNITTISYKNKKDKRIIFKDSYFLLPQSLKNLGKDLLNQDNQKGVISDKFINPTHFKSEEYKKNIKGFNKKHIDKNDIIYCKQDCKMLFDILTNKLLKDYSFNIHEDNTIAKIGYKNLLKNIDTITYKHHIDRKFLNLYQGGITQVFKHTNDSDKKIITLDFNSFYPSQMVKGFGNPMTLKEITLKGKTQESQKDYWNMLKNYPNGFSDIEIELKKDLSNKEKELVKKLPLHPLNGNYFYYGNETVKIRIMNIELKNLMKFYDIKPLYSVYSNEVIYPFKDYINDLYNQRLESKKRGKKALSFIIKLLLNSGYGRFGMKTRFEGVKQGEYKDILNTIQSQIEKVKSESKMEDDILNGIFDIEIDFNLSNFISKIEHLEYLMEKYNKVMETLKRSIEITDIQKINQDKLVSNEERFLMSYSSDETPHKQSSFYIASEITSKARSELVKTIIEIETKLENTKVLYCDTDSIHLETNEEEKVLELLKKLDILDEEKLGSLKIEGRYDKGYYLTKKHYYHFNNDVFIDGALKGFHCVNDIDYFTYKTPTLNLNKLYTRYKNLTPKQHIIQDKTFLNFVSNRDSEGNLFDITMNESELKTIMEIEMEIIKSIFFDILKSGYKLKNGNVLNENEVLKNIQYKETKLKEELELGLYNKIETILHTKKTIMELKKYMEKEEKKKKEKVLKLRKKRKKPTLEELLKAS